jgi:hypothetical protein
MHKDFRRELKQRLQNYTYQSETDAPFVLEEALEVKKMSFSEFFRPLEKTENRMSAEEKAVAREYTKLKKFIQANTSARRVYKIGNTKKQVFIFARDLTGSDLLITTHKVET